MKIPKANHLKSEFNDKTRAIPAAPLALVAGMALLGTGLALAAYGLTGSGLRPEAQKQLTKRIQNDYGSAVSVHYSSAGFLKTADKFMKSMKECGAFTDGADVKITSHNGTTIAQGYACDFSGVGKTPITTFTPQKPATLK